MLALAIGCKGCGDDGASPGARAEAEPEGTTRDQLRHRIASLKIDLTKSYPKRADGVVDCGSDSACFVVMAERCEPALLDHDLSERSIFMTKKVHARYRIEGREGEDCEAQRLVLSRDMELNVGAREALATKGHDERAVDAMRAEAQALLRSVTPPRVTCRFTSTRVLELAVDIADKKHLEGHFQGSCSEVADGDPWPADLALPAEPPTAPPTAPAP